MLGYHDLRVFLEGEATIREGALTRRNSVINQTDLSRFENQLNHPLLNCFGQNM